MEDGQTIQWPNEKEQDKERSTIHHKENQRSSNKHLTKNPW